MVIGTIVISVIITISSITSIIVIIIIIIGIIITYGCAAAHPRRPMIEQLPNHRHRNLKAFNFRTLLG